MSRRKKFSGAQLRALRKEAGYTQEEIGIRVGISRETVSAIENERPETINSIGVEVISKVIFLPPTITEQLEPYCYVAQKEVQWCTTACLTKGSRIHPRRDRDPGRYQPRDRVGYRK
eukprot:TRINITY_DN25759_c1_g1_i1.p2 TRINITY_DN25759_c1_g1~~TRINITY_DN25759_c1_g1_i1.p2  ORF type:complete len:117 (+),score=3.32 TRINITY_DN25759_c1_g1_i1:73-423(+)